jgi:hypothetical protein
VRVRVAEHRYDHPGTLNRHARARRVRTERPDQLR